MFPIQYQDSLFCLLSIGDSDTMGQKSDGGAIISADRKKGLATPSSSLFPILSIPFFPSPSLSPFSFLPSAAVSLPPFLQFFSPSSSPGFSPHRKGGFLRGPSALEGRRRKEINLHFAARGDADGVVARSPLALNETFAKDSRGFVMSLEVNLSKARKYII